MDTQTRIRKIIEETNCSFDVAKAADQESNGNLELAIQIARKKGNVLYSGGKSGLYVESPSSKKHITQFKNGILVDDKFYDFSVDNNIRLKQMLEKGTFDAELLGSQGDTAEVVYTEKLDEEYSSCSVRRPEPASGTSFVGEGKQLGGSSKEVLSADVPDTLEIAKDGDTLFKVMVGNRRVTVRTFGHQSIRDFLGHIEKYCGPGLVVYSNEHEVPPAHMVSEIANKLVFLTRR